MLGNSLNMNVLKYGAICILSVIALIVVGLSKFILRSYIFGVLIFVALVWFLIFKIGLIIMYPGSSSYYKSDIEIRMSSQLIEKLYLLDDYFALIKKCIVYQNAAYISPRLELKETILEILNSSIEMLSIFENNLSDAKAKMLEIFREILDEMQAKHSLVNVPFNEESTKSLKSISEFLTHPTKINKIKSAERQFLLQRMEEITRLSRNIVAIIGTYCPPEKTWDFLKYKLKEEKLYQIKYGYQLWNSLFQYEVHLINNNKYVLECAVICKYKSMRINHKNNQPPVSNGKYIMFCNPNGVYIQFFAIENTYIKEYLKQGYQVILWNYRGYGQSTGSPTITKSQSDAVKVYDYFTEKGKIIQLIHGYSIGGCAAIGLVQKLQKRDKERSQSKHHQNNPALRTQNLPSNIKLLIVDRSFSSIGNMAIEFGPTLHKLAKLVFTFDNKNLSKQFYELKTEKVILWDKYDEVIPDTASVKCGVLMDILSVQQQSTCKKCTNCMKSKDQTYLNEEVSVLINQREGDKDSSEISRKAIQRFANSIKILVRNSPKINNTTELESNIKHEYDPSEEFEMQESLEQKTNDNLDTTEQVVNQVLSILQSVDGGGCLLPHPISNLRKVIESNPIVFESRCSSYILGLAYYGSVLPIDMAFKSKSEIQLHTIKKIQQTIAMLSKIVDQNEQATKIIKLQLTLSIQNIVRTLTDIKNFIKVKFLLPENKKFGKLVALNSGHNGSLPQEQLKLLMKYIQQVFAHDQDYNPRSINAQNQTSQQLFEQNSFNNVLERDARQNLVAMNSTSIIRNTGTNNEFLE